MIDTQEEMREVVYDHLYQMYSRFYMECLPYITPEINELIHFDAHKELVEIRLRGNLKNYYERIKRNAL